MRGILANQAQPMKPSTGLSRHRSTLVTDCVEAALEIVDLCRLLRDETGLARASFTEFSSCRAALLVILAQSLTKRTERLRASLEQGMGLIRIMSNGVGSARTAVSMIEALERAICRLEAWSGTRTAENPVGGSADSGYERFKNWEMLWKSGPVCPGTAVLQRDQYASTASDYPMMMSTAPAAGMEVTSRGSSDSMMMNGVNLTTSADFLSPSNPLTQMPPFGQLDHFVSNFPQELDEFTAIPCFDADSTVQYGLDAGWMDVK